MPEPGAAGSRDGVAHPAMHVAVDGRVLDDRYHGIGRVTEALIREFSRRDDIAVTLIIRPEQTARRFDAVALASECHVSVAHFDYDLAAKAQFLAWPRFLRSLDVDVAFFPYSLGAPLFGRTPSLAVVHDCIIETSPRFAPSAKVRWMYRAATAASVLHNGVITPSAASAHAVHKYYRVRVPADRVVSWGVDPSFGVVTSASASVADQPLPERFYLQVGARRPHKNVLVLIEALALRPPEEHLVLVGSVDARFDDPVPALIQRLGLEGRVHHYDHVTDDELSVLYQRASAFLYPSLIEGVGLPLLEAMSAGLPVIASDIPVFREVADDAVSFVAAENPARWAGAMAALRADEQLRQRMRVRGREVAAAASWAASAEQLASIFRATARRTA